MSAELAVKDLESAFGSLLGCCLHSPVWTPADADRVLCCVSSGDEGWGEPTGWIPGDGIGYADSHSYTVVRLKNGTFGLLDESSDTTGHGCQCDAATNAYESIADLLRLGVVEDGARDLIRQLLAVPGAVVADSGEIEGAARVETPGRRLRAPPRLPRCERKDTTMDDADDPERRLSEAEYAAWAERKRAELAAELSAMLPEGMRFEWE